MALNLRLLYSDNPTLEELQAVLKRRDLHARERLQVQLEILGFEARRKREEDWKARKAAKLKLVA